jgi:hypothetical protein
MITFLGRANFLMRARGGVRAVTDYNGIGVPVQPRQISPR